MINNSEALTVPRSPTDDVNCNPVLSLLQGGKSGENVKRKVFVGGLPANCTESQLKEHFNKYGTVSRRASFSLY